MSTGSVGPVGAVSGNSGNWQAKKAQVQQEISQYIAQHPGTTEAAARQALGLPTPGTWSPSS